VDSARVSDGKPPRAHWIERCSDARSMRVLSILLVACSSSSMSPPGEQPSPDGGTAPTGDAPPPMVACEGKAAQPRDATWMVDGRRVRVHVPASYDSTVPAPIVLDLHGWGSDGADQAHVSKMIPVSDARGFIAVHPDGTGGTRGWNGGVCCGSTVDDVAFFRAVLDELESQLCIDRSRVSAIGLSNGGFMAHRLGCELSDRITSIGAVAGVVGIAGCNPAHPMPVFHVHGTSDLVIPYSGGGVNGNESVATTIERWTEHNGCTGAPETVHAQGDATCVRHGGCTAGADVTLCTIDGGGHQWPGGESIGVFAGKKSDNLIATEAAWAFFAAHPRAVAN
jgi:polyhydroxybutyrate depolymerase